MNINPMSGTSQEDELDNWVVKYGGSSPDKTGATEMSGEKRR